MSKLIVKAVSDDGVDKRINLYMGEDTPLIMSLNEKKNHAYMLIYIWHVHVYRRKYCWFRMTLVSLITAMLQSIYR